MNGDQVSPDAALDLMRRRIRLRAWRRGMREMDLILGGFADARLETLDGEELAQFEALLDAPDDETFRAIRARITGRTEGGAGSASDPALQAPLIAKIAAFQADKDKTS
jgi:antitoxin CptB